jgi:N-acetylmuramoyl-L-alanine amidase
MRLSFQQSSLWLVSIGLAFAGLSPALANPQIPAPSSVYSSALIAPPQPISAVVDVHSIVSTPAAEPGWKALPGASSAVVMIDPGHGGKDPGAIGIGNLREVDVILPIALQVSEILKKNGITTNLTRDQDYFVGLNERVQMSGQAGATIFVSIHANSIDNRPDVQGLETYHHHLGAELAKTVHDKIINVFNVDLKIPLLDRHTRSARFLVLRKSDIPAILVEVGYVSSPAESLKLGQAQYQTKMARAIAQGILEYLQKNPTP